MGKQDDNIKTIIEFLSEGPKTADEIIKKSICSYSKYCKANISYNLRDSYDFCCNCTYIQTNIQGYFKW